MKEFHVELKLPSRRPTALERKAYQEYLQDLKPRRKTKRKEPKPIEISPVIDYKIFIWNGLSWVPV